MPTLPPSVAARCRRQAEAGSAYLFALMALLVLTVLGLSLAVITQTEVQIGGAERSANRVLYGADAGMRVQLAGALGFRDYDERTITLDTASAAGVLFDEIIQASTFYPVNTSPCNVCSSNTGGEQYWFIDHVVSSEARRVLQADGTVQARKLVSQMFAIEPKTKDIEPMQLNQDPARLNRIKF